MKYIIPIIILSLVLLSCSKDEEETTNTLTCSGTSTGSGPTFGNVTLEEATYLSTCFSGKKLQMEFKNDSSAQSTTYEYGDSSCSGTATSSSSMCFESISVSSTTETKPTYVDGTAGDNVTGYYTTGTLKHDTSTVVHMSISAESTSVYWYNQSSTKSGIDSNCCFLLKFTKQ